MPFYKAPDVAPPPVTSTDQPHPFSMGEPETPFSSGDAPAVPYIKKLLDRFTSAPSPFVIGELRDFATGTMVAVPVIAEGYATGYAYTSKMQTEQRVWTGERWARALDPDAVAAGFKTLGWDGRP